MFRLCKETNVGEMSTNTQQEDEDFQQEIFEAEGVFAQDVLGVSVGATGIPSGSFPRCFSNKEIISLLHSRGIMNQKYNLIYLTSYLH